MTESQSFCPKEQTWGSQEPSERICPKNAFSDGSDASKILTIGGLVPDEWQRNILLDWMGVNEDKKWAASSAGLSVPRQNGKTLITIGRIAAGMVLYGEWTVYTAHVQKTSTETFKELKSFFEGPKMRKYVREIRAALGREEILLMNGGRVVFAARTRTGGRGFHGDLLVFDEAQELTAEQQASFLPAISASGNPQTVYLGTPPDENTPGTVFRELRKKALNGETQATAWTEFSVKEIGDVTDRKRWAVSNPAMGRRIQESTIAAECEQMNPDTFARERLGWWSEINNTEDYVIDKEKWELCASDQLKPEGKTAYGVRFTPDGSFVYLCGAVCPEEGPARISLIRAENTFLGTTWLSDWLNERSKKAACVVIDGRNGVDYLIGNIKKEWRAKGSIIKPSAKDVIAAATLLVNDINEQKLTWYKPQEQLSESATTSVKRTILGGWGFGGENSGAIEAAALALWGCRTTKRNPSRKMRIG